MPNITSKDFPTLVSDMATAIQGRAAALIDFTVGAVLRATVEAIAAVVVWLEGLILLLLQKNRAATSSGTDLDSWVGDYGLTRLPATASTGTVTFSRFTNTQQALVPVGSVVQTADGTQCFTVAADTTNAAYSATQGGYVIPAGTSSLGILVQNQTAGAAGNVVAGAISVLASAIPYVDTVTNAAAFTNGADAETDAALRIRFVAYIASLSKATEEAIGEAITSLQIGVSYSITPSYEYNGAYRPGYFYVVVDDGTGAPGSTFLSAVSNAIDAVRGFTISFGVFGPTVLTANVVMTATIASGYDPVATKALAQAAVEAYIASLQLSETLAYTRLAKVAYDASPGITNITSLTLNGGTADLTATAQERILTGTVTVN